MLAAVAELKAAQLLALVALVAAARVQYPVMVIPEQLIWVEEVAQAPALEVVQAATAAPVS